MNDRFAAVAGIRALDFGDEWVVFNPLSWDAHILNDAAALVLDLLGEAQGIDDVAVVLGDLLVEEERAGARSHAEHAIDELMQLGLVKMVPADGRRDR